MAISVQTTFPSVKLANFGKKGEAKATRFV